MREKINLEHRAAEASYREKSKAIKELLDRLGDATASGDFLTREKPNWSDVGSLAYVEARLQELCDFIFPEVRLVDVTDHYFPKPSSNSEQAK